MSDVERLYHEKWLGMAQPIEGLVVSVPVLLDAQCMQRLPVSEQHKLITLTGDESPSPCLADVPRFLAEVLGYPDGAFTTELPEALRLDVVEGHQTIRPTRGLLRRGPPPPKPEGLPDDSTPTSRVGEPFVMLTWELPVGLDLDAKENVTGVWFYEPTAKFERLLRSARVPIGLLFNGVSVRLVYAPHGESTGHLTFRFIDLVTSSGRPLFDAMMMLLHARRLFGVLPEHQLPALLEQSRRRQANVTEALAEQVFEALTVLLAGFEGAAERDGTNALADALARGEDHVYGGLLTTLLRLVFILYAEDRGLLPVDHEPYAEDLSVKALYEQLLEDAGQFPDAMSRRYGAWPRLLALFRCVFFGASHGRLHMPPRRGQLFDPEAFPFLEGWSAGGAPVSAEARAAVQPPSVDDETVFRVLDKLIVLEGQRLSYQSLDVEQIGSVYEALMGFHVKRLTGAGVCLKPAKVWVSADEVLEQPGARRGAWLEDQGVLEGKAAKAVAKALEKAKDEEAVVEALEPFCVKGMEVRRAGQLVLQPGAERRRTSSHYTPRSLSAPIVRRALEPLLKAMGDLPSSQRLLNLKVCDPAMGSGAFLVEACRFLADLVVAAWTREGVLDKAPKDEDVVMRARRLVAQRCLYGVDKNPWAVNLAKLSLWLVTLAKADAFTFLDHALKCGDSLVGLDLEQIRDFRWDVGAEGKQRQLDLSQEVLKRALAVALEKRQAILQLALDLERPVVDRPKQLALDASKRKEELLRDADEALAPLKRVADACVGAFFACETDKEREKERARRLDVLGGWLARAVDGVPPPMPQAVRELSAPGWAFHWALEFPEVFHGKRPDPLDEEQANRAAWMDGFVGNPPFLAGSDISGSMGAAYLSWILDSYENSNGNADICAYFVRRAGTLLGTHGSLGLITTSTIANGDSREVALAHMTHHGFKIHFATSRMKWPGKAKVYIVSLGMSIGSPSRHVQPTIDGIAVKQINSFLRPKPEPPTPKRLASNSSTSFLGVKLTGEGFRLENAEAEKLLADPKNADIVKPYMRGETVNDSPTQSPDGYVIDFNARSLIEARNWPELLALVEERVRPQRESNNRKFRRENWWLFGETASGLRKALADFGMCIVTIRVPKHIVFSILPTDRIFNEKVVVIADSRPGTLAILQSRVHTTWASKLSIRYTPSDCLETFPFPAEQNIAALSPLGAQLHTRRREHMIANSVGLTTTYNRLQDASVMDAAIQSLRALHEEVDRAVLDAYGWSDVSVPPYCGPTAAQLEDFEDEVLDRLFDLNERRAHEESLLATPAAGKKPRAKRKA